MTTLFSSRESVLVDRIIPRFFPVGKLGPIAGVELPFQTLFTRLVPEPYRPWDSRRVIRGTTAVEGVVANAF